MKQVGLQLVVQMRNLVGLHGVMEDKSAPRKAAVEVGNLGVVVVGMTAVYRFVEAVDRKSAQAVGHIDFDFENFGDESFVDSPVEAAGNFGFVVGGFAEVGFGDFGFGNSVEVAGRKFGQAEVYFGEESFDVGNSIGFVAEVGNLIVLAVVGLLVVSTENWDSPCVS